MEIVSQHACFGGLQQFYRHHSNEIGLPMKFSVFLPPQARQGQVCPAVFYLAGLTCSEETLAIKAGAQRVAAREGIILISPDTSPRGAGIPGESDEWDFGVGAGFYVDATREPWRSHYRMFSYITCELYPLMVERFGLDRNRVGIMGHSMGGHGALVLALRRQDLFRSVSALAPIAAPIYCPWGETAFTRYLGDRVENWAEYDATELMKRCDHAPYPAGILIDQGLDDKFLAAQLNPHMFEAACAQVGQPLTLRRHRDYNHGYYFVSSFIEDHLMHHAGQLQRCP
jgi:S-formylglutathione hydrolase